MYILQLPLVSFLQSIQTPTFLHSSAACSSEEQALVLHASNLQLFFLRFRFTYLLQFEKTLGTQDRMDFILLVVKEHTTTQKTYTQGDRRPNTSPYTIKMKRNTKLATEKTS